MADTLEHIALQRKFEEYESDDDSPDGPARRLAWQICMNNLDWDLLSPSINDTFADEFLKLGGEFENTKALKDAVRATRAEIGQNTDRENP
jgi:hypothetical protein